MNKDVKEVKQIIIQAWEKWKLDREAGQVKPVEERTLGQRLSSMLSSDSHEFAIWLGKQGVAEGASGTLFLKQEGADGVDLPPLNSDDIENWIKEYTLYQKTEKMLNRLFPFVIPLITPHLNTLSKKRQRLRIKDDYGLIDESNWEKELNSFFNKAIAPHLNEFILTLSHALLYVGNKAKFKDGKGSVSKLEFVREILKQYINATLDDHTEEAVDNRIDITSLDPIEYEHFCADVLKKNGWEVRVTQTSGDQGVDILAEKDGNKLALQCKKHSKPVGNKAVQEVHSGGIFYKANVFAVVSPVEYTRSARELANSLGVRLLHHDDLATLTIKDKEQ